MKTTVLVLNDFIKQTKGKQLSKDVIGKIYAEFDNLTEIEKLGYNSLRNYLENQNGKELKGAEHIFKYRLTDGDRILYTYGKYLNYIGKENQNSIVLLKYAKHDNQGDIKKLPGSQEYISVAEISKMKSELLPEDINDFGIEDLDAFVDLVISAEKSKHRLYQLDVERLKEGYATYDELEYKLTPEQVGILENYTAAPCPQIILGGAGTGKTLIALHLLNDLSDSNDKECRYFTQSRELLHKVENIYYNRLGNDELEHVKFSEINEFCFQNLKKHRMELSRENLVETTQFLEFLENNLEIKSLLSKKDVQAYDIWTEIRGVIKGGLSSNWTRTKYLDQGNFSKSLIKKLEINNLIKRNLACLKEFALIDVSDICIESLNKEEIYDLKKLKDYFSSVDISIIAMDEKTYLELDEEFSVIEKENRKTVFYIYKLYQDWLEKYHLFDENDLARETLKLKGLYGTVDYLIIDEVQDYSELQIYLLSKLVKNENGIIYLGDQHQIINPTLFDERKLRKLHRDNVRTTKLSMNFRCQAEIVELCNAVANFRRSKVAMKKQSNEIDEKSARPGKPNVWLDYSEENVVGLINLLIEYPNVAIIVASEKEKNQLIKLYGEDKYNAADNPIIFHVAEIKGMEYQYVVCMNIVSSHIDSWDLIFNSSESKKKTKYRYYFNLFYVGITRAQENLCLVEKTGKNFFYQSIFEETDNNVKIKHCDTPDSSELGVSQLKNAYADWFDAAETYYYNGKYDMALRYYRRAKADKKYIYRCNAEIAINDKAFEKAIRYFLLLNEINHINNYADEVNENTDLAKVIDWLLVPETLMERTSVSKYSLYSCVKNIYEDPEEQTMALTVLMKHLKIRLQAHVKKVLSEV